MPGTLPDYLTTGEVVNIAVQKGVLTEGMVVSSKLAEALKQVAIEIHNKTLQDAKTQQGLVTAKLGIFNHYASKQLIGVLDTLKVEL